MIHFQNNTLLLHFLSRINIEQLQNICKNLFFYITGRESELTELQLGQPDIFTVITGPRGIGKTELARRYAQNVKHQNISNIIWFDSTTHETLIESFRDLAVYVGLDLESKSKTSIIRETCEYLRNRPTLLILDHAHNDNIIIKNLEIFIGVTNKVRVIITSRDKEWEDYKIIKLKQFKKENSIDFIKKVLNKEIQVKVIDSSAEKLSDLLKNLPLALKAATSHIIYKNTVTSERIYSVDDYIRDLLNLDVSLKTTTTTQRPFSDQDFEGVLVDKIKEEGLRLKHRVKNEVKESWELIGQQSKNIGSQITGQIKNAFGIFKG